MSARTLVVRISAAVAARDAEALKAALTQAASQAESKAEIARAVDETLLQSVLFVGYPAALDALALWREHGVAPPPPSGERADLWEDRGSRLCHLVYGDQYGPLRENIRALHPDAEDWMVTQGYGRVLGRPGLDMVSRELSIVAQLAVQGATRQLYSHMRGALRVGATPDEVQSAVDAAKPWMPTSMQQEIADVWSTVRSRHTPMPPPE